MLLAGGDGRPSVLEVGVDVGVAAGIGHVPPKPRLKRVAAVGGLLDSGSERLGAGGGPDLR